jgi:hypothetical protein
MGFGAPLDKIYTGCTWSIGRLDIMGAKLTPTPKWIDRSMQGIAYWIGHRRALYSGYSLGESALVAELCNMIYTHIPSDHVLRCEVQYTELLGRSVETSVLSAKARADIVIGKRLGKRREGSSPQVIIEVKRASASNAQIDNDLRRLAAVKLHNSDLATYLAVIAEAERPKRFVNDDGEATSGIYLIPGTKQLYRVRRVFKAAASFKNKNRAQFACLVEVSPEQTPARLRRASAWTSKSI